jgi:hypothetical protein
MKVSASAIVAGTVVLALFSACASQPAGNSPAASGPKCEVDVKKVCQEIRNAPSVDAATGLTMDSTEIEQSQPRTTNQFVTYQVPNGSLLEVSCEMNAAHRTVVYAHLMPGPQLTTTDAAALESAGYCVH